MSDPEAPTPRLSAQWQIFATAAREVADRLRDEELRKSRRLDMLDPHGANLVRQVRMVVESYAAAFGRWTTHEIPIEQKQREQQQFAALNTFARLLLGEPC